MACVDGGFRWSILAFMKWSELGECRHSRGLQVFFEVSSAAEILQALSSTFCSARSRSSFGFPSVLRSGG